MAINALSKDVDSVLKYFERDNFSAVKDVVDTGMIDFSVEIIHRLIQDARRFDISAPYQNKLRSVLSKLVQHLIEVKREELSG